jgi:ActR/RegA family two-component response regulator/DNA-binding transcriptional ArsR family regulator
VSGQHALGTGREEIRVLLVDDDETWASSTAQVLEHQREAFVVETATGLAAAAAAFEDLDPDCVVCDYRLEAATGLDFLAEVRERDAERPFILVTGQGSESVASDAIGRQVTDYIPKRSLGGRSDLLARRVESAVERHRTEQALERERRSRAAMLDMLTATASREGVAREFCEHLVGQGYACAWVGTLDGSGGVVPQAAAGATGYLDETVEPGATPDESDEPALAALAAGEQRVVTPIEGRDGWRSAATAHGFESAAGVPIEHDGSVLGVLAVYSSEPTVDGTERDLLAEYGETVGYALRAAGWRESLLSAQPVTLGVELADESVPLVALADRLPAARLTVLTTVPRAETLLYVLRAAETSAAALREAGAAVDAVEAVEASQTARGLRCELVVAPPTPETVLADSGARVVDTAVSGGSASMTVVSREESVRAVVETVRAEYPDADVRSVRSTETGTTNAADIRNELTDKQRRAVELALYSGYFERPREHNTSEVAEKLGVSRQTFTQHLRAGQRKLLTELLDANGE